MVVCLNGPRGAAVGVAVKPPDESFRRLETATQPLLYLSPCVLYTALILGEGCLTGMTDRTDCLGYLPSHTDIAHFEFKPSEFRTTFR